MNFTIGEDRKYRIVSNPYSKKSDMRNSFYKIFIFFGGIIECLLSEMLKADNLKSNSLL